MTSPQPDLAEPAQPVGEGFALDGELSPAETAAIAALAAYLAVKALPSPIKGAKVLGKIATKLGTRISAGVWRLLTGLGLDRRAVTAALTLTVAATTRRTRLSTISVAGRKTANDEPLRRAAYLLAAAKRLTAALRAPDTSDGPSAAARLRAALLRERRFLRQHLDAADNRQQAALAADKIAVKSGPMLRWVAQHDDATTPDCRALDGTVFNISSPPGGIYPGAKHPRCRCYAEPA